MFENLSYSMPFYVTRSHYGETTSYSMSLWMSLLGIILVWVNIVGWGVYGVYELVSKVV